MATGNGRARAVAGRVALERTASRAWVAVELEVEDGVAADALAAHLYGQPDRVVDEGGRRRYLYDVDPALLPGGAGLPSQHAADALERLRSAREDEAERRGG